MCACVWWCSCKGWDLEVGGGQVSVVDGTVVLRASISFVLIADSQTPPFQWWLQLGASVC